MIKLRGARVIPMRKQLELIGEASERPRLSYGGKIPLEIAHFFDKSTQLIQREFRLTLVPRCRQAARTKDATAMNLDAPSPMNQHISELASFVGLSNPVHVGRVSAA